MNNMYTFVIELPKVMVTKSILTNILWNRKNQQEQKNTEKL